MLFSIGVCASEEPMRGVWVSTVYNLDYPSVATTDSGKLKSEIDTIVNNIKDTGYNAVFLQVRPSADSIYPSSYFPWSRYLTGTNGTAPANGFDPLKYWVEVCHANSLEIHAWINPYRVTKNSDTELNSLSYNHPAKQHPEWLVKYSDKNYYFNPGIPEVRSLVCNGVNEILKNYKVDGIHMDDYFYPGAEFNDSATYQQYNQGKFSSIADWRRNNVDELVKSLHTIANAYGVEFGISPSGIWDNLSSNPLGSNTRGMSSYTQLYADSRGWVKKGYVDYIAPQIYWEFGYAIADYEVLSKWWANVCEGTDVKLYIGLATYRGAEAGAGSAWYGGAETLKQMQYNASDSRIDGEIHFRYKLINNTSPIKNTVKSYYSGKGGASPDVPQIPMPLIGGQSSAIKVFVNGKRVMFDVAPVAENGRTLVPMRGVFEALGADVTWNQKTATATAVKNGYVMVVKEGSESLVINGNTFKLDVPAKAVQGRMLIPLRAISEGFGYKVEWNGVLKTVNIIG